MSVEGPPGSETEQEDAAFVRGFTAGALLSGAGPLLSRRLPGAAAAACAAGIARLADGSDEERDAFLTEVRAELAIPVGVVERLLRCTEPELRVALCERGAGVLGRSLGGAPPVARARAMASVGPPFASLIDDAARLEGVPSGARAAAQLAVSRTAQVKMDAAGDPRDRLLALGFFDLLPVPGGEPAVSGGAYLLALAALARRLPVEVREVFARVCPPLVW